MPDTTLDRPEVLRAVFHPRPDYVSADAASAVFHISFEVAPDISVGGRLYVADPDAPAILFWHGNGEIAADYDSIAPLYTGMGINLLVVDYRGYGSSGGSPTCSSIVSDATAVCDACRGILEQHGLAAPRIYVMGRSLGSAAAIEAAAAPGGDELSGLIVESGFADTFALLARLGVWLNGVSEAADCFANADKINQVTIPTLVIHGQADVLIPAADGEELFRRAGATDKQLLLVPDAGHNDLLLAGRVEYFRAIKEFVFGVQA